MIKNLILVGFGGGVGSILRYLCQRWINESNLHSFPLATFLVNVAGCLLIGVIYGIGEKTTVLSPQMRLYLTAGFCGGFTTFSTFAFENMVLIRTGNYLYFFLYVAGSVLLGMAAVFLGYYIIKITI